MAGPSSLHMVHSLCPPPSDPPLGFLHSNLMSVNNLSLDSSSKGPRKTPCASITFHLQLTQGHSVATDRHSLHLHW